MILKRIKEIISVAFSIIPVALVFGTMASCMFVMKITASSTKKAKASLEDHIENELDGALKIVYFQRFFNAGNMNANIFTASLEDKNNREVKFVIYWNAKKRQPEESRYSPDFNLSLKELHEQALKKFEGDRR